MPAPNVTSEKHLQRGSKRHSKERTDDSTNDQTPDKDRHNYCHRMQANVVSDNPWRVEKAFQILYDNENRGHDDWVSPITPLECRDENSRHPANDDPDIGNHREHDHHCADYCRKIQAEQCQRGAPRRTS